jgi:hypothetical protein
VNLTNVRLSDYDPLLRPTRVSAARADHRRLGIVTGRTFNVGVRLEL